MTDQNPTDLGYRKLDFDDEPATRPATATGDDPGRQLILDPVDENDYASKRGDLAFGGTDDDSLIQVSAHNGNAFSDGESEFRAFRKANGIDWEYAKRPAPHPTLPGQFVPNKNWITRKDFEEQGNPKAWGPFANSYGLTQLDVLDRVAGILHREGCKVKSSLVLDQGGAVAITAERRIKSKVGPRGEKIASLITVVDSVNGRYLLRAADHLYDVVCRNTLAHAIYGSDGKEIQRRWSMAHSLGAADKVERLAIAMAQGGDYADAVIERLFSYDKTPVSLDKVATFFSALRKADDKSMELVEQGKRAATRKRREKLVERDVAVLSEAPACVFDADTGSTTFYGLHQWATFTASHLLAGKATQEDEGKLLEYTVLGSGSRWQNEVSGQIDSWWQEASKDDVKLQTVSLV